MPFYLVTADKKGPILRGPYNTSDEVLGKQGNLDTQLESRGEVFELPTTNRARAARMIKEQSTGLVNFKYGN